MNILDKIEAFIERTWIYKLCEKVVEWLWR